MTRVHCLKCGSVTELGENPSTLCCDSLFYIYIDDDEELEIISHRTGDAYETN